MGSEWWLRSGLMLLLLQLLLLLKLLWQKKRLLSRQQLGLLGLSFRLKATVLRFETFLKQWNAFYWFFMNKSSAGVGALKHILTTAVQIIRSSSSESFRKIVADLQSSLRCVNRLFFRPRQRTKGWKNSNTYNGKNFSTNLVKIAAENKANVLRNEEQIDWSGQCVAKNLIIWWKRYILVQISYKSWYILKTQEKNSTFYQENSNKNARFRQIHLVYSPKIGRNPVLVTK